MRIIKAHHCESIDEDLVYESKAQEQKLRTILLLHITKSICKKTTFMTFPLTTYVFGRLFLEKEKSEFRKEVDHIPWVWGSVPRALRARGSPANNLDND